MAKIIEVILTEDFRGKGIEGDPCRLVPQWWSREGELLFEKDPCSPQDYDELSRINKQLREELANFKDDMESNQ